MTMKQAKETLRVYNMTINRTPAGDLRVNHKGADEMLAYYTDDIADAVATGIEMSKRWDSIRRG